MPSATENAEIFDQWKTTLSRASAGDHIHIVRHGASPSVFVAASEHFGISRAIFARFVGISPATVERKIKSGGLLGQPETERLSRIAMIELEAESVFGSSDKARTWLTQKHTVLGDTPLSMLDTETGACEVRKILSAIAYGGVI